MPNLQELEAAGNPLVQPPLETCERGIDVMRRFYFCLKDELKQIFLKQEPIAINTTLKVIFVGMAMSGKTSIIKRLIKGRKAKIPSPNERTVGVKTYEWDPKKIMQNEQQLHDDATDSTTNTIDTRIQIEDENLKEMGSDDIDLDVKFSVWDFAGQHVYHATHELFFSPRALFVLVWDMGSKNDKTRPLVEDSSSDSDFDDDDDDDIFASIVFETDDSARADKELEKDIDEKVQFWIDCIQTSAPGAAILPVASHADRFVSSSGDFDEEEAQRRCKIMKERLLEHEQKRIQGLEERLNEYREDKLADSEAAVRVRELLSLRPKLLFGEDEGQSVVRVSSKFYKGFDDLRNKFVQIASGRERGGFDYPIFRGHVGTRIPRMRLQVRDVVRELRAKETHVIKWSEFVLALKNKKAIDNVEDIGDALHFLANVGELCYFGDAVSNDVNYSGQSPKKKAFQQFSLEDSDASLLNSPMEKCKEFFLDGSLFQNRNNFLHAKLKKTFIAADATDASLLPGLSQFVFLNPRWLVASVACILDHGLGKKIYLTRRKLKKDRLKRCNTKGHYLSDSSYQTKENCPVITSEDAHMLWGEDNFTAASTADTTDESNKISVDFLQNLLVRFGIFVPIDLNIEKASLGGKDFTMKQTCEEASDFFFLPCLLGPQEPEEEVWTYKTEDAYKTTICNSILFPDVVPPGLMERITSSVLNDVFSATQRNQNSDGLEEKFYVANILCWQSAFFLRVGMGGVITEIFCHLVGEDSNRCVASKTMGMGMTRLVLSGRGQAAGRGRKIWDVGFSFVDRAVERVLNEYGGLEFEKQVICPQCIAKRPIKEASVWDWTKDIDFAANRGLETLICQHGHRVNTALVNGYCKQSCKKDQLEPAYEKPDVLVKELFRSVVLVALLDKSTGKIDRVGSGFVFSKNGLIVTAAHTVININGRPRDTFGEDYYGLPDGRIVIGVIPKSKEGEVSEKVAVFRYYAKIVAKDESIESGVCNLDACVLRITTRLLEDVVGSGHGCFDHPEIAMRSMKGEKLQKLKTTQNFEHEEYVRIMGFNQRGEGVLEPGDVDRCVDYARGFVVKEFKPDEDTLLRHRRMSSQGSSGSSLFKPRAEIVVMCQDSSTIEGHSGGPCVNEKGEVVGILSRADQLEKRRCYIVPTSDWMSLVKQAKKKSRFD